MRPRRAGLATVAGVLAAAALLAGCSDDDGRARTAGNVTAPPVSLETPETPDTTSTTDTTEPDDPDAGGSEQPSTGTELDGTAWLLRSVPDGGRTVETSGTPVPAVMTFTGGAFDVYDGVNTVSGEYSTQGSEVRLELGTPSEFPYADDAPQYELIGHLGSLERAELDGDRLVITLDDGGEVVFERANGLSSS